MMNTTLGKELEPAVPVNISVSSASAGAPAMST
jgi:hypothetical protein